MFEVMTMAKSWVFFLVLQHALLFCSFARVLDLSWGGGGGGGESFSFGMSAVSGILRSSCISSCASRSGEGISFSSGSHRGIGCHSSVCSVVIVVIFVFAIPFLLCYLSSFVVDCPLFKQRRAGLAVLPSSVLYLEYL